MPDLLIELLSEEIPARMQPRARADLMGMVTDGLVEAGLTYAGARAFSTPRRLAVAVQGLPDRSQGTVEERRGPRVGAPDKAVEGFLRGAGVERAALEEREEKKGAVYVVTIRTPGRDVDAIVADVLERAIRGFPWPKSMRWGEGTLRWVRPLRRILCVLTDEGGHRIVPLEVDGIVAGDVTEGHSAMAPAAFPVTGFADYAARLSRAHVVLDAARRADAIRSDAANLAFAAGASVVEDEGLLEEVAGLVEWPVTLMGAINAAYLDLPAEVLRTSMKEHQKFFSVADGQGRITRFVTVANRETADDGATILAGNARVLAARLADAKFFWANDLAVAKAGMEPWLEKLRSVTFHARLGSQYERIERIAALAREIAPAVGADPEEAARAARLAKADLASEMVYEFPELQGVMGRYYALEAGESEAVADAARDHYAPLGPSDDVPTAPVTVAVALADKIDTLTGFWAIDEKPTGSKDPYALRRAALGVIRLSATEQAFRTTRGTFRAAMLENIAASIWIERLSDPNPDEVAAVERDGYEALRDDVFKTINQGALDKRLSDLLAFLQDRLKIFLRDRGIRHDIIDASIARNDADDLVLLTRQGRGTAGVPPHSGRGEPDPGIPAGRQHPDAGGGGGRGGVLLRRRPRPDARGRGARAVRCAGRRRITDRRGDGRRGLRRRHDPDGRPARPRRRVLRRGAGERSPRRHPAQPAEPPAPHPHGLPEGGGLAPT